MGFGLNAAMMAGVNDGLRQQENDQFLRDQRAREAKAADLNQQVLTGQVEDMNRARADQAAVRGAAAGAYQSDQATTAAGGIPMGRAGSITAMRDAAAARGDVNTVQQLDSAWKSLQDEGIVAVTKAALMGQDGPELGKVFNSYGTFRVDPATVKVDANGNITGNKADGTPFQGFNLAKMAVLTGLVKPDEWASAGDGQTFNKRTGQVQGSRVMKPGEVLATPSGGFGAQVPFAPKDSALVVPEDSKVVPLGPGGQPGAPVSVSTAPVPTKIRKEVSDEVDNGYRGPLGELTGTAQTRDAAKNVANQLFESNAAPDKRMTPQLAAQIGRQVAEGTLKPVEAVDKAGATWRAVQVNGQTYVLDPTPVKPAPEAAPKPNTAVPQAAIDALKSKASDPKVLADFRAKYGVDPQKYLGSAPGAGAKPSPGPGVMIGATEAAKLAAAKDAASASSASAPSADDEPEPVRWRGRSVTKEWKEWDARRQARESDATRARLQKNADALKNRSFGVIQP